MEEKWRLCELGRLLQNAAEACIGTQVFLIPHPGASQQRQPRFLDWLWWGPYLLLASGGVATYRRGLHCFRPSVLGGLVVRRDPLSSPTRFHLFLCPSSSPLRELPKFISLLGLLERDRG